MFGNLGEIAKLMQSFKEIQANAKKMKENMASAEFTANAPGGQVSATVSGDFQLKAVRIDPAAMQDAENLSSQVQAAVNGALDSAKKAMAEQMKEISGGLNLPGLF